MNAQEALLHYPFDQPTGETLPAAGSTNEVAPGVRCIRMALPDEARGERQREALDNRRRIEAGAIDGGPVVDDDDLERRDRLLH